ncbi:MAG TPA: hypothetical protein VJ913_02750 [Actinomycetota bacterium]|nr:hypothetical protein [Actinomycetota bacterium]
MRFERGYVEMRLLVVLALVAALVWVLPFVLLGGDGSEPEPAATAPFGATAPLPEVTLPDVAAPPATGPAAIGAGATGSVPTGPVATGPGDVLQPADQAYDLEAQSDAVRVAHVYYAETGTFQGFGPDVAVEYDPSVVYSAGSPLANMVAMTVTPTTVVLVTIVDGLDGGGDYLCAAIDQDVVTFGRANATMPAQCQGGWG